MTSADKNPVKLKTDHPRSKQKLSWWLFLLPETQKCAELLGNDNSASAGSICLFVIYLSCALVHNGSLSAGSRCSFQEVQHEKLLDCCRSRSPYGVAIKLESICGRHEPDQG